MEAKATQFRAGAGRFILDLPEAFFPHEGFDGVHDPLHARALVLDNGRTRSVLAVVDLTSLRNIEGFRHLAAAAAGAPVGQVWVCAGHTFSAPHLQPLENLTDAGDRSKNEILLEAVNRALREAVLAACRALTECRMGFATSDCSLNVNRDVPTNQGWWKGSRSEGPSDKTLSVLRFEGLDGHPVAVVVGYPVQSSVMLDSVTDGRRLVTSDLGGAVARSLEEQYGGSMVALWNVGAAGDQDPLFVAHRNRVDRLGNLSRHDIGDAGWALVSLLAERLAGAAASLADRMVCRTGPFRLLVRSGQVVAPGQEVFPDVHSMKPSRTYRYVATGPRPFPYALMVVGDVVLVGVQVELVCLTALALKKASPFHNTVVMTLVNGAAKYLPDADSYDRITYAAMNSFGAKGAAEILVEGILADLDRLVFSNQGDDSHDH